MKLDYKTIVIASIIGSFGGGIVSNVFNAELERKYDALLKERPPIALIDFASLIADKQLEEGVKAEDVSQMMDDIAKATLKLHEAGYLIMERNNVLGAPESLLIKKEEISKW